MWVCELAAFFQHNVVNRKRPEPFSSIDRKRPKVEKDESDIYGKCSQFVL